MNYYKKKIKEIIKTKRKNPLKIRIKRRKERTRQALLKTLPYNQSKKFLLFKNKKVLRKKKRLNLNSLSMMILKMNYL